MTAAGYGDDGSIWGERKFFCRNAVWRKALSGWLICARPRWPGGDAAAHHPVQAAAGFLTQCKRHLRLARSLPRPPFDSVSGAIPRRHGSSCTKAGAHLHHRAPWGACFDAAAALLGFTREVDLRRARPRCGWSTSARSAAPAEPYPFPFGGGELDFRPLLLALTHDRLRGRDPREIARAFQLGVAGGVANAVTSLSRERGLNAVVFSGGVFQNELLLLDLKRLLERTGLEMMTNRLVPPNDGGISLGQAALAAFSKAVTSEECQVTNAEVRLGL